jgi:virginiamycin B lyase
MPRIPLIAATLASLAIVPALAQQAPTIREWTVPWSRTVPRDPAVDRRGHVWFVGQGGDYVGVLDPASGEFRKFDLAPGTGPHSLILDSTGIVWYTGNASAHMGRLDPRSGAITRYPMSDTTLRDPHTPVFDRDGDIWFTVQAGNAVGHLSVATGAMRFVRMPVPGERPYGIKLDRAGRPWFALFGTNRIGTIDPVTFRLEEFPLPRAGARPRRMAITSDGAVWYGDYNGGFLGRFDTRTHEVQEWPLPGGASARPYAVEVDDQDRIWVVETGVQPNRFVGFDTRSHRFLPSATPQSGGGTIRNMVFDPREKVIWFGTDANTIGRATLPTAAVP